MISITQKIAHQKGSTNYSFIPKYGQVYFKIKMQKNLDTLYLANAEKTTKTGFFRSVAVILQVTNLSQSVDEISIFQIIFYIIHHLAKNLYCWFFNM
jgi:hypothetical protein